ncbi:MAG: glutathione-dependent formaldehyde dehydrogenase, partial [Acidimicrobiia bacterium]
KNGIGRYSRVAAAMQRAASVLPRSVGAALAMRAGVDRLAALRTAIDAVRRGGTLSIVGVYGGAADPIPMLELFDKGVQVRLGQAHVRRWVPEILPVLERDDDPLGLSDFVTHRLPLEEAPRAYAMFQAKEDGAIKVVLTP